ncbi:MAG TPA: Ni/Fe hydrogenase subunit alpha [Thermoproteota archaeon]|nr:Ni/Fe hydrogenase subunit alpha [Thermoproteota archaeon]
MSKEIKVEYLARVEGEGSLHIKLKDGKVEDLSLRIFEPPRFFEAFLVGRSYMEVPDITARICGICPVAYQMSSARALEKVVGLDVPDDVRKLRKLLYLGEYIESHVLHAYLLHAPDFLGYESALEMAKDHPDIVKAALKLKQWGNRIMEIIGGRSVHPVSPRVGGFHKAPGGDDLSPLLTNLDETKRTAFDAIDWAMGLKYPDLDRDTEYVSLWKKDEYPMLDGRIRSSKGIDVPEEDFEKVCVESQVSYSTARRYMIRGKTPYVVGPQARVNLNHEKLAPEVQDKARELGISFPISNPYKSIIARTLETAHSVIEAEKIIREYRPPASPYVKREPRAGEGAAITEAPRGMLFHRYSIGPDGIVKKASIVSPTSQNQTSIEADLLELAPKLASMQNDKATWLCEQTVRNYDPCISCSAHFLKLDLTSE